MVVNAVSCEYFPFAAILRLNAFLQISASLRFSPGCGFTAGIVDEWASDRLFLLTAFSSIGPFLVFRVERAFGSALVSLTELYHKTCSLGST